jgi:myo-inositol-1(or 4)-monophosphatase
MASAPGPAGPNISGTPPTQVPQPAELETIAVRLATGAAGVVADSRATRLEVSTKTSPSDLVTQVDRATEAWLVEQLGRLRPDDATLGEEGGSRSGRTGVRWLIDPIDGTVNFVLGLPQYAVSVAAEVDGTIVAGAVANPATGECFRAHLGGGAWLGTSRLSGPRAVPLERAVLGTGFSYQAEVRARQAAVLATMLDRVGDIRRLGAASLDLCFVAAGWMDGYFEAALNPWDWAAGALVAIEAGCEVTGIDGGPPAPGLTIAARPGMAAELRAMLRDNGADRVLG